MKRLSLQADEHNSAGKIEAARIKIIDALEIASELGDEPYYNFFMGEINYLDEHLLPATEFYRKACQHHPHSALMLRGLGVSYSKRGVYPKAIAAFERGLARHPHDFRLWRQQGVTFSRMQDYPKAFQCFDKAIELEPNDYHSHRQKGVSLLKAKHAQEALLHFSVALRIQPNDFRAMFEQAKALHQVGNVAESERTHQQSLQVQKVATLVPPRESLLARIKYNRVRHNQERILLRFRNAIKAG